MGTVTTGDLVLSADEGCKLNMQEHPGSGSLPPTLVLLLLCFSTILALVYKFPSIGKNHTRPPNPPNFRGLFPFSGTAEDLGLQQSGCSVSSSVSSRIKYGVTAENSCSMEKRSPLMGAVNACT